MQPNPIRVVHLFSETACGFIPRLWIHQLAHFNSDEFRFSVLVPDKGSLGEGFRKSLPEGLVEIHEIPSLFQLGNPVYAFRAYLSLRAYCSPENTDLLHTHFPNAAILAAMLRRRLSKTGLVHSLYLFAGDWKARKPPRFFSFALRRIGQRAERILAPTPGEEEHVLRLEIGKKYQLARIPLAIPDPGSPSPNRAELAEAVGLSPEKRWIGFFLPSFSRRETRNILTELMPLSDLAGEEELVCLVPAGRLSEARTLGLRLRLNPRFHFAADLSRWEDLIPQLAGAVFPMGDLVSVAAAMIALAGGCAVWIPAGSRWVDFLPQPGGNMLCLGQSYRSREEVETLLSAKTQNDDQSLDNDLFGEVRAEHVAGQLRQLYLDVLAEKGSEMF
jgi:hypothetical protein